MIYWLDKRHSIAVERHFDWGDKIFGDAFLSGSTFMAMELVATF